VDVLNGLEPSHVRVVDVVGFVVQDGQFFDVTDDDAEVDFGIGSRSGGRFPRK